MRIIAKASIPCNACNQVLSLSQSVSEMLIIRTHSIRCLVVKSKTTDLVIKLV